MGLVEDTVQFGAFLATLVAICYGLLKFINHFTVTRRELRRLVQLTKQGPIYRAAMWLVTTSVCLARGDDVYGAAAVPTLKCSSRSSDRIVVDLRAPPSTTWGLDDEYEVETRVATEAEWRRVPVSSRKKTTAQDLEPGCAFVFRARTRNPKGASDWSADLAVETLHLPRDGGGPGPGYTWRQSSTAVQLEIPVPASTRAKDISVKFAPKAISLAGGPDESIWELCDADADGTRKNVLLTLDKAEKTFTELDHWPNVIVGHPSIDTRKIPTLLKPSFFQ